jgi:hypothetical protein
LEIEKSVSTLAKPPKPFQVFLLFPLATRVRGGSRSNRVCEEVLRAARHHTGLFTLKIDEKREEGNQRQ